MDAIAAYDLSKSYDKSPIPQRLALQGINLTVAQGGSFGCVGPVGSGKTTLARLLAGLARPSSGQCSVLGLSPSHEAARLHGMMGAALSSAGLYNTMSIRDNLRFFAGIHQVDRDKAIERISFLMHRLGIWEDRDKRPWSLPTGVQRRAGLARALVHSPKVLLVDGDEDGMDLETAGRVRELLDYVNREEGVALMLCTRDMDYAQLVCRSFGLLDRGVLMARGSLEALRVNRNVRLMAALRLEKGQNGPEGFALRDGLWQKEIDSEDEMPRLIAQAVQGGASLYEARVIRPSLSEIYRAYQEIGGVTDGE